MKEMLTLMLSLIGFSFLCHTQTSNDTYGQFVENRGQILDIKQKKRPDVLYFLDKRHASIFIRKSGISYLISNNDKVFKAIHEKIEALEEIETDKKIIDSIKNELTKNYIINYHQIDVDFLEANKHITIDKKSPDFKSNYYNVSPEILNVPSYKRITYKNVYNGIDIAFYGKKNGLEYDFKINPSGNINDIKLLWKGAESISINENGSLVVATTIDNITESIPEAYQYINGEKIMVKVSYNIEHIEKTNEYLITFNCEKYNKNYTLIIDPWTTFFGGTSRDEGHAVETDSNGNIYLGGSTRSINNIGTPGAFQSNLGSTATGANSEDGFLAKFSPNGTLLWATYYGGEQGDDIHDLTVDQNNNIYITGYTRSTSGIASTGAHQDSISLTPGATVNDNDAFLAKFSPNGTRLWGTYFGGPDYDAAFGVKSDAMGNVYIVGATKSASGIATTSSFQPNLNLSTTSTPTIDGFVAKFNTAGVLDWATYYGGTENDQVGDVDISSTNEVYIGGSTNSSSGISTVGSHQQTLTPSGSTNIGSDFDAFLVKFSSTGTRIWGTYYGGPEQEGLLSSTSINFFINSTSQCIGGVIVDTLGFVYLAGATSASTTGIATAGGFQATVGSTTQTGTATRDGFLARFSPAGIRDWGTYLGGSEQDYILDIKLDKSSNNILVSGDTYSTNFPTTPCASQPLFSGPDENNFITRFKPNGTIHCSSFFGTGHMEQAHLALFGCDLYLGGETPLAAISTPGAHQTTFGGWRDAYLSQMNINTCGIVNPNISNLISVSETNDTSSCNTACNGSAVVSITLDSTICSDSSNLNYLWSTGDIKLGSNDTTDTIANLCAGNYWVEVSIDNNCTNGIIDTLFFSISSNPGSAMVSLGNDTTLCQGENLILDAQNNGSEYLWSTGDTSQTIIIDTSGTYSVQVTNSGCISQDTITVNFLPSPDVTLGNDTTLCANSLVLDAQNIGSNYLWSNNSNNQTITVSNSGNYWVVVNNGTCNDTANINVTFSGPQVNLGADTTICGMINLSLDAGNSGSTYLWNDGSALQTLNVTSTGTYWVEVTLNGCTRVDSIMITSAPQLQIDLGADTSICGPININLDAANSGAIFLWNNGSTQQNLNVSNPGTYWVQATLNNCTDLDSIVINSTPIPIVELGNNDTICEYDNLLLDAGNVGTNVNYTWQDGSTGQTFLVNENGMYSVSVEVNGCTATDSILVVVQDVKADFESSQSGCAPLTINFSNLSTSTIGDIGSWVWQLGDGSIANTTTPSYTYQTPGLYDITLIATTNQGCVDTNKKTAYIEVFQSAIANFKHSSYNSLTNDIEFVNLSTNAHNWHWNFGDGNSSNIKTPTHTYQKPGNYLITLQALNLNGCHDTLTKYLTINQEISLFVPNVFTPDDNQFNKEWTFIVSGIDIYSFNLTLYNRWGEVIWKSADPSKGWDGRYNGEIVQNGTYIWVMEVSNINDAKVHKFNGHVTVLR